MRRIVPGADLTIGTGTVRGKADDKEGSRGVLFSRGAEDALRASPFQKCAARRASAIAVGPKRSNGVAYSPAGISAGERAELRGTEGIQERLRGNRKRGVFARANRR